MSDSGSAKWLVRTEDGRIQGPLTTESVLRRIRRGEFGGNEEIALYPGANWIPITQDPQFYDQLLDALSNQQQELSLVTSPGISGAISLDEKMADEDEFEMVKPQTQPPVKDTKATVKVREVTSAEKSTKKPKVEKIHHETDGVETEVPSRKRKKKKKASFGEVIELKKIDDIVRKQVAQKAFLPLAVGGVAVLVLVLFLFPGEAEPDRLALVAPHLGREKGSASQADDRLNKGRQYLNRDTKSDYVQAQNEFVRAVELDPSKAEAWGELCLSYFELWPYANQDSKDMRTVSAAAQYSSKIPNPLFYPATCRFVDLWARGRLTEAQSLVDSVLDTYGNQPSALPTYFYYFKARLLDMGRDPSTALGYVASVQSMRREWLAPYVFEADLLAKVNRVADAGKRLQQVLKAAPGHRVAKILLGLLEYRNFNHPDRARDLLRDGVSDPDDIPRPILSDGYFGLAEIALKANDEAEALKYAQMAYSYNPSNTMTKNLIVKLGGVEKLKKTKIKGQQLVYEGDQYLREGDCNSAQAHYIAAYEMNKKNAVAAMKAAKCLWALSFPTQAIEWLNTAIKADYQLIEAYVTLADYYAQRYNFVAASQVLSKAQSVSPKSYDVFRGFAIVELRRRNPTGAVTWAKKALEIYDADVETYVVLGRAYLDLKNFTDAYSAGARAVEVDPNHREAQVIYAQALAGVKGVDTGVGYILELINRYPLVMEYRLGLGKILMSDERYSDAEKVYRQVVEIDEKPREAWLQMGRVLRHLGQLEGARDAFLKAAVLDPSDAEPLFEAGQLYLEVNKPAEARQQFQRVLNLNTQYPLVNYFLGKASMMAGEYQTALDWADKERKANPNLADPYQLAAEIYLEMKEYRLCAREYQKAIQLRPQGVSIYVRLARCYRLSGNLDIAASMLTQAASKDQGFPDIYKEQGLVFEMKGDLARALESYDQYFALDPNAADIPQIRQRIQSLQRNSSF